MHDGENVYDNFGYLTVTCWGNQPSYRNPSYMARYEMQEVLYECILNALAIVTRLSPLLGLSLHHELGQYHLVIIGLQQTKGALDDIDDDDCDALISCLLSLGS